jgi:hypothetical protein
MKPEQIAQEWQTLKECVKRLEDKLERESAWKDRAERSMAFVNYLRVLIKNGEANRAIAALKGEGHNDG